MTHETSLFWFKTRLNLFKPVIIRKLWLIKPVYSGLV